jgi:acetyl-CoA carboxylase beta subunit
LEEPAFLGVLGGAAVGAQTCWLLADELQRVHRSNPASTLVLLLDASGHAATRQDEALMLSAYLAHLSIVAVELAAFGQRILLWIPGAAAGAVYVAFAAPAEHVSALPTAKIRILPEAAVRQIVGASAEELADPDALIRAGVIDALLDRRLEA